MNISDIVNRDIVNLTNCESEPIHIPGSIQPHGFLLAVRNENQIVDFCSANSAEYINLTPQSLLGKSLTEIFGKEQADNFVDYVQGGQIDSAKPFVFTLNAIPYNTTVHQSGDMLVLELEPFPDGAMDLPNLYSQTKNFVSSMERQSHLSQLCKDIAGQTRNITGYDRVMIYRFDPEYNGEVIAESKRDGLESFEGQKYPHTDIPVQARKLYIRNQLRMIANVNYQPVPILTLDNSGDKSHKSLDLSLSVLRSVSPIHIEYLKNMGVAATLTISLLKNNKLWGLIACHHYSPKILPYYTRLSALLQGHFLASQIAGREVAEEFEISESVDKALLESLALLHENENFIEENYESSSLLELANAAGFVIYHQGKLYKNGSVPPDEDLIKLFDFLYKYYHSSGFHTEQLIDFYPNAEHLSKFAAGVIYHSIAAGTVDGILWLRPEKRETINWAGNPHKAVVHNGDGGIRLSPRKSFELWLEEVKNKSASWRKSELNSSSNFAYSLQKHINLNYVSKQESQNRALNDELKVANKELANLNWISTHDLKEPLRKIQIFASKILDRHQADISLPVKDSVERMRLSAEKMQRLIEDILSYSRAGNMEKATENADLSQILAKVLDELRDDIDEKKAIIKSAQLPVLKVIPFQIHQLFVNLISNALKFSSENVEPLIDIAVSVVNSDEISVKQPEKSASHRFYAISFQDNGIGFDRLFESRIFDVFQRLHPGSKYPGTGIGLAICKKIMENHQGYIQADSEQGKGSRFTLYFPLESVD